MSDSHERNLKLEAAYHLRYAANALETLILKTPTGLDRENLTEANIHLQAALEAFRKTL